MTWSQRALDSQEEGSFKIIIKSVQNHLQILEGRRGGGFCEEEILIGTNDKKTELKLKN